MRQTAWLLTIAVTLLLSGDLAASPSDPSAESHGAASGPASAMSPRLDRPDPARDATCLASRACTDKGRCTATAKGCVAATDYDCRMRSAACHDYGGCVASRGRCVAATDENCSSSVACRKEGLCWASKLGYCYWKRRRASRNFGVGDPPGTGLQRSGPAESGAPAPSDPGSAAAMGAGIAIMALGGLGAVAGGVMAGAASANGLDGLGEMKAGGVLLGVGGGLILIGAVVAASGSASTARPRRARAALVRVEPLIGPAAGGLRGTF